MTKCRNHTLHKPLPLASCFIPHFLQVRSCMIVLLIVISRSPIRNEILSGVSLKDMKLKLQTPTERNREEEPGTEFSPLPHPCSNSNSTPNSFSNSNSTPNSFSNSNSTPYSTSTKVTSDKVSFHFTPKMSQPLYQNERQINFFFISNLNNHLDSRTSVSRNRHRKSEEKEKEKEDTNSMNDSDDEGFDDERYSDVYLEDSGNKAKSSKTNYSSSDNVRKSQKRGIFHSIIRSFDHSLYL